MSIQLKLITFHFLLLIFALPSYSQEYIPNVQKYDLKSGLSHMEVFAIHQDSRGFLWLGTKYGLNRYDGHEFKWWTKEKNQLSDNTIHHILEDAAGWLWVFTVESWYYKESIHHVSLVNIHTGEVRSLKERFGESVPFEAKDISTFIKGPNQSLYFTTKQGQLICYRAPFGFTTIPTSLNDHFIPLYIPTPNSIYGYLKSQTDPILQFLEIDSLSSIKKTIALPPLTNRIEFQGTDLQQNHIYTCFSEEQLPKLYRLPRKGSPQQLPYQSLGVTTSAEDWSKSFFLHPEDQSIWYKGSPHLSVFHPEEGLIYDFKDQSQSMLNSDIRTLYFDQQGITWIGTANGLYALKLNKNPFQRFLALDYPKYKANDAYSCRGIWSDDEQLLVNTYKGRMQVHLADQSFKRLPYYPATNHTGYSTLLMYYPIAILADQQGGHWFSEFTLCRKNPALASEQLFHWERPLKPSYDQNIWSLYLDKKKQLWVGSESGLGFLNVEQGKIQPASDASLQPLKGVTIYAFVESQFGFVWLATDAGLFTWEPEKGIFNRYWSEGTGEYYLPHDKVMHLHEDQDGILWLGTLGGGLIRLSTSYTQAQPSDSNPHYRQFTIADGLSNNNLYAVYEDAKEHLWISSDYGIIQFDKNDYFAKAYLPEDGITHYEFNRASHFQAEDGRLYFGGLNGVTSFHPDDFYNQTDTFSAALQVTDFQQFKTSEDKIVNLTNQLLEENQINLAFGDRFFRLQFTLLDYLSSGQVRYAWKIEGQDEDWTLIKENYIRVSGLHFGQYTLRVKGQAANGQWSPQELRIPIHVFKPLYLQLWFIVLLSSLFLSACLFFYYWRTSSLEKQKANLEKLINDRTEEIRKDKLIIENQAIELQKLDKAKSRFFANISHELRTPLSLMLGPVSSILKRKQVDNRDFTLLKTIQQNGLSLLKLINEILDLSKLESSKLELQEASITLYPLMRRLVSQFESHAQRKGIALVFKFFPDQYLRLLLDGKKLEVIINNLLSNAIKFTPKEGQVAISVKDLGNSIRIEIADTGIGIPSDDLPHIFDRFYQSSQTQGGTGIGLALCRELSKLMKGQITVDSQLGKGSRFILELPKQEILGGEIETPEAMLVEEEDLPTAAPLAHQSTTQSLSTTSVHPPKDSRSILIVEDNAGLRDYISSILRPSYRIVVSENGQAALDWLESSGALHPPALILSDVMMPIMNGFQLLENLKSSEKWRHIPVVMLTARAETQDKLRALRIGVDDYLIKPFEEDELVVRIDNVMGRIQEKGDWQAIEQVNSTTTISDPTPSISAEDQKWLEKVETHVIDQLSNHQFNTQALADQIALSRSQLFRRLKRLTGLTPSQYIEEARLNRARQLLEGQQYDSVKAIAYSVGIRHMGSFSAKFKNRFGKSPSTYLTR